MWNDEARRDIAPIRVRKNSCHRIGEERQGKDKEDPLGISVRTEEHQSPDEHRGNRNDPIAAHAHEFEGRTDSGEFTDHKAGVGQQDAEERYRGQPQRELFADQRRDALAGERAQSHRHFLHQHQGHRHQDHEKQCAIDVLRACTGVRRDPGGVVSGIRRNQTGPRDRQVAQRPGSPGQTGDEARAALSPTTFGAGGRWQGHGDRLGVLGSHDNNRGKWNRPRSGSSASSTSSARIRPIGRSSSSTTNSDARRVFTNCWATSPTFASAETVSGGG